MAAHLTAITLIRKKNEARAQLQLDSHVDLKCYFRRRITKYATANSPPTPYNASKPGKPRNPAAFDAAADATDAAADATAPLVTFLLATADATADATAPLVTFLLAFAVAISVCANATVDPATIERITNVAKTAEKSFLPIIFTSKIELPHVGA
ncbi:MAG: hypothetical protein WAL97_07755 [Halobacteriota archaeon]